MDFIDQILVDVVFLRLLDIDGVIYCVGVYDLMIVQDWDCDKGFFMMDVNVFGVMCVLFDIVF